MARIGKECGLRSSWVRKLTMYTLVRAMLHDTRQDGGPYRLRARPA